MGSCNSMFKCSGRAAKEDRKPCSIIYKEIQNPWLLELLAAAV